MAVIWGFNLSEMSWGAFGHARMFDRRWHLRRERFVVYQLAMLISLAAECTATYSLSKYEFHQSKIEALSNYTASVHNNPLIDAAIVCIVFCVLVATLFGADFFFLLFFPRRTYPRWYDVTKKVLAVIICAGMAAGALMSTIVVATRSAYITGVSQSVADSYTDVYYRPPLRYRHFPQNIAWVVLIWPAFLSTVASTIIMFIASAHDSKYGTAPNVVIDLDDEEKHTHAHNANANASDIPASSAPSTITNDETPINRHSGVGAGGGVREKQPVHIGTGV